MFDRMDEFVIWQVAAKMSVEKTRKQFLGNLQLEFKTTCSLYQAAIKKDAPMQPLHVKLKSFIIFNTVLFSFHEQ